MYFYWIIFAIALFAGIAMTVREGIWSNTITLMNVFFSGIVAFGFYSKIVVYLDEEVTSGQHTYWLDFCIIWALFCATMVILRTFSSLASTTKMRFKNPIDPVGGPLVGALAAFVMATFLLATLHTAPMSKDTFGDKLAYTNANDASLFSQPDAVWLRFMASMSQPDALGGGSAERFSAQPFVTIYGDHRQKFDKSTSLIVKRNANPPPAPPLPQ